MIVEQTRQDEALSGLPPWQDPAKHIRTGSRTIRNRAIRPVLFVCLTITLWPCLQAAEYSQEALNRADSFLRTQQRGRDILSYVHFGADYHGHRYLKTLAVSGSASDFALVYRFNWEDDGVTDVAFLCDRGGSVYQVQIVETNAVLSRPFFLANASISVLGNGLIEYYKDKLSEEDRRQLHKLVNDADAKGLLEWSLRLQQVFQ
jgi:hypothetical protein